MSKESKDKISIPDRWWTLILFVLILISFGLFPACTLIVTFLLFLILSRWFALDRIGQIGRKHPVWTTIILFALGIELYIWIYGYGLEWKEQFFRQPWVDLLANIKNGEITEGSNETNLVMLLKKAVVMMVSTPASIIPIILAPYFWVLWIWRHNNSESTLSRNRILDKIRDDDLFDSILEKVCSDKGSLRALGINKMDSFLSGFENNNNRYLEYSDQAIAALVSNTIESNGSKEIEIHSLIKAIYYQRRFCEISNDENASNHIVLEWVNPVNLCRYNSSSIKSAPDDVLYNFKCKVSTLEDILFFKHPIGGGEWSLTFSNSVFEIDKQLSPSMISYFKNPDLVRNSKFVRINGVDVPSEVLEGIY